MYLLGCQVRVAVGDSNVCYCVGVTPSERQLTPLFDDSSERKKERKETEKKKKKKKRKRKKAKKRR